MGRLKSSPVMVIRTKIWFNQLKRELNASSSAVVAKELGYLKVIDVKLRSDADVALLMKFKRWQNGSSTPTKGMLLQIQEKVEKKYGSKARSRVAEAWCLGPGCNFLRELSIWSSFNFPTQMKSHPIAGFDRYIFPKELKESESVSNDSIQVIRNLYKAICHYMLLSEELLLISRIYWARYEVNSMYSIIETIPSSVITGADLKASWNSLKQSTQIAATILEENGISEDEFLSIVKEQVVYLSNRYYGGFSTDLFLGFYNYMHDSFFTKIKFSEFELESYINA